MAYNKANVIVGPATIQIDDANPGWTSGGVSIEHAAENYDVEVDQEPNAIKSFRTKETFKVKTNLVENTVENIKIALGIASAIDTTTRAGYRRIVLGGSAAEAVEHTLDIYGNAPGSPARQRRIHFYRVVAIEFGPMTMEKNKEQVLPVTFEALYDSTNDAIGYLEDQTAREYSNVRCRVTVA
jgi:hypothetical protein